VHENAEKYNLSDCIECGACAWVCPSNIPLVHYYRQEKAEIEHQREEAAQAERAKLRFEAKKQRLEEERLAREARSTPAPARPVVSSDSDPVAAAISRIKAQQNKAGANGDLQAEREARKEQARQHQAEKAQQAASGNTNPAVASSDDARKAAVAAALARAKARKAELVGNTSDSSAINAEQEPAASVDQEAARKAAVAAAIARAKAKKAQTESPVVPVANVEQATEAVDPDAARKAAVAAAIARAKAKKAQAEADSASNTEKQG
jgi:electron transport complex protein RnfC